MTQGNSAYKTIRRLLSRHPRLHRLASGLRRRISPAWRGRSASKHWDQLSEAVESHEHIGWLDCELIEREHIRPQISGDENVSFLEHFIRTHIPQPPIDRVASLGCGGGHLERGLLRAGWASFVEGFDASEHSLELARSLADKAGFDEVLRYQRADLDCIEFDQAKYDVIIIKMALHHFSALEHVLDQVILALRPGGLLMFNEYVGPNRFQWTDRQLELTNAMLHALPSEIRSRAPVEVIRRPIEADVMAQDPSESIRSSEILERVAERFDIVEIAPYGGTLLNPLLSCCLPLFDLGTSDHRALLRTLMSWERSAIANQLVSSDFAYAVARPRVNVG